MGTGLHLHASLLNPLALQQLENSTSDPFTLEAPQRHTSLALLNLPCGSNSCTAQPKSHQVSGYVTAPSKHFSCSGHPAFPQWKRASHWLMKKSITLLNLVLGFPEEILKWSSTLTAYQKADEFKFSLCGN